MRAAPHMRGASRGGRLHRPARRGEQPAAQSAHHRGARIPMLHSRHDPANHFSWAANMHRQTRGTTVPLPYEGAGHSVYGRSDCTRDAVDDYLTELRIPSPGSSCAPAATN
ncbi:alpha/beta hydrolase [Streptomyces sp. NPDC056462]|uniref:alpha/beta hydrolase n=1 Tax=Streptomyces sp. NPDC056462 TaxID=3345826 RepID=UPI0036BB0EE5